MSITSKESAMYTSVPPVVQRIAARIADPIERELWLAQQYAGDVYEAVMDGSPELPYWLARREYDRASRALIEYRQSKGE